MQEEPLDEQKQQGIPLRSITSQYQEFISIALSLDEKIIATGMNDSFIRIWDTETWEYTEIFQEFISFKIVFSNDLMITAGRAKLFKIWSYKDNFKQESRRNLEFKQFSQIKEMAVSSDSKYLVSIASNVIFWDLERGIPKFEVTEKGARFVQCKIVNNNKLALLGSEQGELQLWNLKNTTKIRKFRPSERIYSLQVCDKSVLLINDNFGVFNLNSGKMSQRKIDKMYQSMGDGKTAVNYCIPYVICNDEKQINIINTQSQKVKTITLDISILINGVFGMDKQIMVFHSNDQLLIYKFSQI